MQIFTMVTEAAGGEEAHALPAPAWVFGIGALGTFVLLLAVTWAFKNVANRH